mgnify:CR=1 FL=1
MPTWDGMSDPPPNERRVDGGKVTEMVSVNEWLADPNKNRLVPDPELIDPPHLPAFAYRDHLHDNTRAHGLFDTANPGITTYVVSAPHAQRTLYPGSLCVAVKSVNLLVGWCCCVYLCAAMPSTAIASLSGLRLAAVLSRLHRCQYESSDTLLPINTVRAAIFQTCRQPQSTDREAAPAGKATAAS